MKGVISTIDWIVIVNARLRVSLLAWDGSRHTPTKTKAGSAGNL